MRKILFPAVIGFILFALPARMAADATGPLIIENLVLPESLGTIEERYKGASDRWVIHIQDIHAHFTAQENIAAIIDHLNAVYGLRTVALEGGWTATSFADSWGLPSSRQKQMLARSLLEDAYLTGPGYAALFSQTPLTLVGIEDRQIYNANRQTYLEFLAQKPKTSALVEAIQDRLSKEKSALFNADLLSFDKSLTGFRDGEKAETFLPDLIERFDSAQVEWKDLEQISLFVKGMEIEKSISEPKLKGEAARLKKEFKRKRLSFEELLKSGAVPEDKLRFYPESLKYLALLNLQENISFRQFFSELETVIARVKEKLYISEEERLLDDKWERFLVAKRIVLFQATPDDLDFYEREIQLMNSEAAAEDLGPAFELGLKFYELAKQRDDIFVEKVRSDERLGKDVILVAGGFHSVGMLDKLKSAGISYVVITPSMGDESHDESLYYQRLKDEPPQDQTLSPVLLYLFPGFDKNYVHGVQDLTLNNNIFSAKEIVLEFVTQTALAVVPAAAFDFEAFKALPRETQIETLKGWIETLNQNTTRMVLGLRVPDLEELLADAPGRTLWEDIRNDRSNTVVLVYENVADIPMEAIGGKFQVRRTQGSDIYEVVTLDAFQNRFRGPLKDQNVAAIFPNGKPSPDNRILGLKVHPSSLLFRLFLSRPDLRALAGNQEFLDFMQDLLLEIEGLESLLRAA